MSRYDGRKPEQPYKDSIEFAFDEGFRTGIEKAMEIARENEGKFVTDGACKRFREILMAEIDD